MAEIKAFGVTFNTDRIMNIPDKYKILAGFVLALIVFGTGFLYLVNPVYAEYQKLKEENSQLEIENSSMETKLGYNPITNRYRGIDATEAEKLVVAQDVSLLKKRIPNKPNIISMIYDLERIVEDKNKIDLFDINQSDIQRVNMPSSQKISTAAFEIMQIPISLNMEANYPKVISLFRDFERYERVLNVSSVSLSPISSDKTKFSNLKVSTSIKALLLSEGKK